jgi:hypothetical protein
MGLELERGHWEEARNLGRQNHIEDLRWRRSPVAEPQNSWARAEEAGQARPRLR